MAKYKYLFKNDNFDIQHHQRIINRFTDEVFNQKISQANIKNNSKVERFINNMIENLTITNKNEIDLLDIEDAKFVYVENINDNSAINTVYIKNAEDVTLVTNSNIKNLEIKNVNNVYLTLEVSSKEELEELIKKTINSPISDINDLNIEIVPLNYKTVESIPETMDKYEKELKNIADANVKTEINLDLIINDLNVNEYDKADDIAYKYSKVLKTKENSQNKNFNTAKIKN
jgi:hypothetical protein